MIFYMTRGPGVRISLGDCRAWMAYIHKAFMVIPGKASGIQSDFTNESSFNSENCPLRARIFHSKLCLS